MIFILSFILAALWGVLCVALITPFWLAMVASAFGGIVLVFYADFYLYDSE